MKVKTTKIMFEELKKALKNDERTKKYELVFSELTSSEYSWCVGSNDYEDEDFNSETGKYNVFVVVYPYNYYASNKYINSELLAICARRAGGNFEKFIDKIIDEIEI